MATICNQCGNIIGDIYPLGGGHVCWRYNAWTPPYPYSPQPIKPLKGQKCDLCGSTAIDHTERNCQLNRLGKHTQVNDLVATNNQSQDEPLKSAQSDPKRKANT